MAVTGGGVDERGCSVRGSSSGNQSLEPPWLFYILGVGPGVIGRPSRRPVATYF